jgi:hypothetical protein
VGWGKIQNYKIRGKKTLPMPDTKAISNEEKHWQHKKLKFETSGG